MKVPVCKGCGVYSITNTKTGKVYVGSSLSIYGRLLAHRQQLRRGAHGNEYLQRAWGKYGERAFRCDILELCKPAKILKKEQHWINSLKTTERAYGYNMALKAGKSPMDGRNHSEQSRLKMSQKRKGISPIKATEAAAKVCKGKARSEEVREKIGAAQRGNPKTEAHRLNMVQNHWSKRPDAAEIAARSASKNRGRKHTMEHRAKISESNRRRWQRVRAVHATTS